MANGEKVLSVDKICIGGWMIGVDADGDLRITSGEQYSFTLRSNGDLVLDGKGGAARGSLYASGTVYVDRGRQPVIAENMRVSIRNQRGWLNATGKIPAGRNGLSPVAYWQEESFPDPDSHLTIRING